MRRDSLASSNSISRFDGGSGGLYTIHSRSQSTPLKGSETVVDLDEDEQEDSEPPTVSRSTRSSKFSSPSFSSKKKPRRIRAPSDPFLDTPSMARSGSSSYTTMTSSTLYSEGVGEEDLKLYLDSGSREQREEAEEGPSLRIWVAPDLTNPEVGELVLLFPVFVRKKAVGRLAVRKGRSEVGGRDEEEGLGMDGEIESEGRRVSCGTGRLWAGAVIREGKWENSWWRRMMLVLLSWSRFW